MASAGKCVSHSQPWNSIESPWNVASVCRLYLQLLDVVFICLHYLQHLIQPLYYVTFIRMLQISLYGRPIL